jgi:hypothetical protein
VNTSLNDFHNLLRAFVPEAIDESWASTLFGYGINPCREPPRTEIIVARSAKKSFQDGALICSVVANQSGDWEVEIDPSAVHKILEMWKSNVIYVWFKRMIVPHAAQSGNVDHVWPQ